MAPAPSVLRVSSRNARFQQWGPCSPTAASGTGAATSLNAANAATTVLYEAARQRILAGRVSLRG